MDPHRYIRKNIPEATRREVLELDKFRCRICGVSRQDGAILHIDHIHPASKGGTNDSSNLRVLCKDCNIGKGDLDDSIFIR